MLESLFPTVMQVMEPVSQLLNYFKLNTLFVRANAPVKQLLTQLDILEQSAF